MLFVALLFLVVPLVELYVIVQAAQAFGIGETIIVLVLMSVVGAWLVKQQGVSVWRRFNDTMRQGRVPHREIVDGALILFAGALLLTPGFLSDVLGLFLLFPPTRALVRTVVIGRFAAVSVIDVATTRVTGRSRERRRDDGVWEADSWESGPTDGSGRGELDR